MSRYEYCVYEERYKEPCRRVVRVLMEAGLHPALGKPSLWKVYVPKAEYAAAHKIVWGEDAPKETVGEKPEGAELEPRTALEIVECEHCGGDPGLCTCKREAAYEAACEAGVYHGRMPRRYNREGE
jgi:hypothetical protein